MDVWGPARVRGQGHERYFLLVVDDYSRYTTVFPLRSKGEVTEVLIDWIRAARLRLRESFGSDFPVLRLHSDRGGEFSSALLGAFCRAEGIRQTFTLLASPQQNGIAERRIGMVMDVARTSMIHAAAPHFLWPFAVQYAAHQLNLQPRVSLPETSPTLLWTGKVGDASAFRVWGSRAFVRDMSADKLSPRAVPCIKDSNSTEMWQIHVVPMPKERQVAPSISTKGEAVGSGDGANGRAKEMKSKKCNLGGTSKLGEHEEGGAAAQKGVENPKAAAEEEYGENMWGTIASAAFSNPTSATGECDWLTLHRRMGHVALPILQQLVKNEMVAGIRVKGEPDEVLGCPTCMQAKFTRYPFSSSEATAKAPLYEVVMDVVGPLKLGAAGAEYFLTIVDVYTRMTWVYVLSKKSDVAETVKTDWLPMVERQQDRLVKTTRTDRGEFLSKEFSLWLKKNGIRHSLTMPYSPAMNGIAERANRTITETARGLLIEAGLPDYFWPDALSSGSTTTRQSSLVNGGEEAKDAEEEEEEVQQVSERAPTLHSRTTSAPQIRVTPQQRQGLHVPAAEEEGRGKRRIQAPNRLTYDALGKPAKSVLAGAALLVGDDEESDYDDCAFVFFSPVEMPGEPVTLKEALESSDAEEWKNAMESELKSMEENGTWELVELPEGRKAITSKWLFKIKSDADGKIERYKSRLVAKGYQQKEKVVKQMDVTTAFLNGVLEEEIFMVQPEGFDDGSGRVLRRKKALYGLKQAPRQWYLKLRGVLEEIGFTPSTADHSLFMLGEGEQRSFMVVYVDDILIFSPSSDLVKEVMLKLQDKFKCMALGDMSFYLRLHIERDVEKRCMRVHQRKYQKALASNFGQSEGHVATPFPSGFKCVKGPEEESVGEEERRRFHSLVGSLMYTAVNTRPDVAFATGQLARVVQCPNEEQVAAGMRVAKYLGQTPTVGLQYSAAARMVLNPGVCSSPHSRMLLMLLNQRR
ncbi:unnamed protein product [Closterium sp. NIES-54]